MPGTGVSSGGSRRGRTSYLYGTVHAGKAEWMYPGPTLARALKETDTIALEMDMFDSDIQTRIAKGMQTARRTPLPPALEQRLRRQAEAACLPYESLAPYSPEIKVVTLSLMLARKAGLEPAYAVDAMLAGFGHQLRHRVISLETPELQMKALHMGTPGKRRVLSIPACRPWNPARPSPSWSAWPMPGSAPITRPWNATRNGVNA